MRIANLSGRLSLVRGDTAVDVAAASGGRFGPAVQDVYERFDEFRRWAATADLPQGSACLGLNLEVELHGKAHAAECAYRVFA